MTEIYNMAGHLIRRLNQISVAVFSDRMNTLNVEMTPVQFAALSTIKATPFIDQVSLARAIAYDKATLGAIVDRLEQKGLIMRPVSSTDRRSRVLSITPAASELLELITPEVLALQNDILCGLSEEEKSQLLTLLHKTTDAGNSKSRAPLKRNHR